MTRTHGIRLSVLVLCLSFAQVAVAGKRVRKKGTHAASHQQQAAPSPPKAEVAQQPTDADRIRRMHQMVHHPLNAE